MSSRTPRESSDNVVAGNSPQPDAARAVETGESDERLYLKTARGIAELITAQGLNTGDRLPSEADLSEELHVSRATIREAIVALDVSGVVRLRRNASALVRDPGARLIDGRFRREGGPFEILKVRQLVEPQAARMAAERATDADFVVMEATVERMVMENKAGHLTEFGDRDFHLEIARAAGNSVLAGVIADLWRMREQGSLWSTMDQLTDIAARRSRAVYEHVRILEAIRSGSPDRAAAAMAAHLESTYQSIMLLGAVEE